MIEQTARVTRIMSENLARAMNRRKFIKRAGETVFAGVAALAAGHMAPALTSAGPTPVEQIVGSPQCAPPGPYCNTGSGILSGCHGGSCFQHRDTTTGEILQCRVFYIYQAGCWTTHTGGGYWVCCDCECFNSTGGGRRSCGCAQWSGTPDPRPDGGGKA
jgi:hypothetical protein